MTDPNRNQVRKWKQNQPLPGGRVIRIKRHDPYLAQRNRIYRTVQVMASALILGCFIFYFVA